ncbi:M28 family peptidase [Longispora sp. NPDC051575]|uniref:M28 family metallopeptidase n=1 Tax=Longispora sp. NPDC051575 TaxID=3154943 RepID=UPI003443D473
MTRATPGTTRAVDPGTTPTDRLTAVVRALASPEYAGRRVGTPGGRAAAGYLAGRLRELGATVTSDGFPVAAVRELYATPTMDWTDEEGRSRPLVHRRDFAEHLVSADVPAPRTGPLARVGDADWSGRWVLVPVVGADVSRRAASEGAAGLLVARGVDDGGWMPKMIAGPTPATVAVIGVRAEVHERMGRGGVVTASVPLRTVAADGVNVHGVFARPVPGGVSVLLTAHHDGVGDDPRQRLPAAADNASGCAVVLESARQLAPWLPDGVGLAVAYLDAEEAGALGSARHAPQVRAGTFVINVDGAAELSGAAAVEAGGPAGELLAALDRAGRDTGVALRAAPMPSDNRRYAAAGLAAVGIGMGMPGYQTPAETPDRVDPATLLAATALVVATVRNLFALAEPVGDFRGNDNPAAVTVTGRPAPDTEDSRP